MAPWTGWRPVKYLDAPKEFDWTDEDVLNEKNDSWAAGFICGMFVTVLVFALIVWIE